MRIVAGLLALVASGGFAAADLRESGSLERNAAQRSETRVAAPVEGSEGRAGIGALACLREAVTIDDVKVVRASRFGSDRVVFTVTNRLPWAIAGVYMRLEVKTEGRSVPWEEATVPMSISGGVEPGETRELAASTFIPQAAYDPLVAMLELEDVIDQDKRPLTGEANVMGWSDLPSERTCNPQAFVALLPPADPDVIQADADPLTPGEKDEMKFAVQRCWNALAGVRDAHDLRIRVAAELERDGDVRAGSIQLLEPDPAPDGRFEALLRSARSAMIRCGPYSLPPEKYAQWESMELVFNAEGIVSW